MISDFFDGHCCKGLRIPGDHVVRFMRLHAYRLSEGESKQQWTEQVAMSWKNFQAEFVKKFGDFIAHHIESVSNNRTRAELLDKKYSELKVGDLACQLDFSHNAKVESKVKTSGQWGNRLAVTLGVALCDTRKPDKEPSTAEEKKSSAEEKNPEADRNED